MSASDLVTPTADGPRFLKATDLADQWGYNGVHFGHPGTGKTTLAATAQDSDLGKNVLFVDIEAGARSIRHRADIDIFRPEAFSDLLRLCDWLTQEQHKYKTVVVDSLTEAQRFGLQEILQTSRTPDMPTLQDYGRSNEQILRLIRDYRSKLAIGKGMNVIFNCLVTEFKDESSGAVQIRPALTPKAQEALGGIIDVIGYLERSPVDGDQTRRLHFSPTPQLVAKFRQPGEGEQMPAILENPSMDEIFRINAGLKAKKQG